MEHVLAVSPTYVLRLSKVDVLTLNKAHVLRLNNDCRSSLACRSVARSLGRSLARSLARSLDCSLARSLARSIVRSLARSLDRSLDRSFPKTARHPMFDTAVFSFRSSTKSLRCYRLSATSYTHFLRHCADVCRQPFAHDSLRFEGPLPWKLLVKLDD